MGRSHVVIGAAAGVWYAAVLPAPDIVRITCAAVVAYSAILADIDHHRGMVTWALPPITNAVSWIVRRFAKHRGALHRPRAAALAAAIAAPPAALLPAPLGSWWWAVGGAVGIGWATHILADARTHSGVPIGAREHVTIGRTIRTGSPQEARIRAHWTRITALSVPVALVVTGPGMPWAGR